MNCLIIGKVWPEPTSTAAGRRTFDLITALASGDAASAASLHPGFNASNPCSDAMLIASNPGSDAMLIASKAPRAAHGWTLHFASAAQRGEHALDLDALGVTTHTIAINDAAFDEWIATLAPDVVIFDRFMTEEQFGWRVAQQCPEALRVLDTSDLHCLRLAREQTLKKGSPLNLRNKTALREIAAIYRCDLTLMISEFEMAILRDEFAIAEDLLAYWPFCVELPSQFGSYEDRKDFILIGSFMHPPNLDAARWCKQVIWPKIHAALPGAELHCYGSYGERYAAELHAPKDGFHFNGRAGDALETMAQYRVNLAPLRYGAGLKGKVFDGFQTGTPTVMTPIASEGIFIGFDWAQEDAESFASEAIKYYEDKTEWEARQRRERRACHERFEAKLWLSRLPEVIQHAYHNRHAHRAANFTGQMLRHHHHRSTEFMSRWIEAKNA